MTRPPVLPSLDSRGFVRNSPEHGRSIVEALRSRRLGAQPPNYELWYAYSLGTDRRLNEAIDRLQAASESMSQSDLDALSDALLARSGAEENLRRLGEMFGEELAEVGGAVAEALASTLRDSEGLTEAIGELGQLEDAAALWRALHGLAALAAGAKRTRLALQGKLQSARVDMDRLQQNLDQIRVENMTDALTGLGNRKYLDHALKKLSMHQRSGGGSLSLLMLDVDHFKAFNDNFGHRVGDQVLRLIAQGIRQIISTADIAVRYGGEEFLVLLPLTGLDRAEQVAERIRQEIAGKELKQKSTGASLGHVTISIGVAEYEIGDTVEALIARADNCLYCAKREGRNRVVGPGGRS
jgi:diguanylate cyclase